MCVTFNSSKVSLIISQSLTEAAYIMNVIAAIISYVAVTVTPAFSVRAVDITVRGAATTKKTSTNT